MRNSFIILLVVVPLAVAGQDIQTTGPVKLSERDSIREYYIKHFPDYFFIYPVLKQRSLNFELQKQSGDEDLVTFKPNNSYSFGVGLYLFEIGVELALAIPIDEKSKAIYGESDARDIQLHTLGKKWGVDAFYQRYTGFYISDDQVEIQQDQPYPQRADIVSRNMGVTGNYVFNNQRFSFRSSYNFAERQVFSKGSLLLFSSISGFRLNADSSIIDDRQQLAFGEELSFTKLKYTTFSIAPGYTYSIVFQGFFLNGTLSIGPAHHWIKYRLEDNDTDKHETAVNSFVAARLSLGYNGERVFGGISFLSQGSNVKFNDARFSNNNGSFKILFGYRFREHGILRKRIWDMIPFKI